MIVTNQSVIFKSAAKTVSKSSGRILKVSNIEDRIAALSPERRSAFEKLLTIEQSRLGPIPRVDHSAGAPLSFAQQRLWFMHQMDHGGAAYNICSGWLLNGPVDLKALDAAVSQVALRHEVLRTTFMKRGGSDVQVIGPAQPFTLEITDMRNLREQERLVRVQELAREEARFEFDLERGSLWRIRVLVLGDAEIVVLLTMHHIISDGWSMSILMREVANLYEAIAKGEPPQLEGLPIQYADYAVWQRATIHEEKLNRQLQYWSEQLADAPILELPYDHIRPARLSRRGARVPVYLESELVDQLRELCRREGATFFMGLLAGFQLLLSRYSGQEDVVVGTDVANRTRPELEQLIGFFVNQLVIRTELGKAPSGVELLSRVRETCLAAYRHQDLPFERVVEAVNPTRYANREPIFQVKFLLQNQPESFNPFPGVKLTELDPSEISARFDIVFNLREAGTGLLGTCIYATDLFESETMERMIRHWRNLLQQLVVAPQRRLSEMTMLSPEQEDFLVRHLNSPFADLPDRCPHELFDEQVRNAPDALAISCEGEQISYAQLYECANRLGWYLRRIGVKPETRVAVCMHRSSVLITSLLAIAKAGGIYVPVDPEYPPERRNYIVEDSMAQFILTDEHGATHGSDLVQQVLMQEISDELSRMPHEPPERVVSLQGGAYLIYTSGSTGQPKGVVISHGSLANLIYWHSSTYQTDGEDRCAQYSSSAFDASIWEIWPVLARGASLHIVTGENRLSIPHLLRWLSENRITTAFLPTLVATAVLAEDTSDLSLRTLLTGADRLPPLSFTNLGFDVANHYGPTEAAVVTTWTRANLNGATIPIGKPIPNSQVYVLDSHLNLCPVGVPGELYIGGAGVARGYWNRPDLTGERFLPDPYRYGDRIYRTGDKVKWRNSGVLEYLGRMDEQLKIRGCRVEPGEVEVALRQQQGIQEAVVVGQEDHLGQTQMVAYIVPKGVAPGVDDLRARLATRVPDYMIPAAFVFIEKLPLNQNGKVDRRKLRYAQALAGNTEKFLAPRNPTEVSIAAIICELMKLKQVSVDANFFEMGGHSLLATQLISRIQETFKVNLRLRQIFEAPTIAELAGLVEETLIAEIEELPEEEAVKLLTYIASSNE